MNSYDSSDHDTVYQKAWAYLQTHNTVVLATCSQEVSWSAAVFYANRQWRLYFLSEPHTRHMQDIKANPVVAATVTEDYKDWREIKGLQMRGRVEPASTIEWPLAVEAYLAKFPFAREFLRPDKLWQVAGKKLNARFYRFSPEEVYFLDNASGFSSRTQVQITG